MSSSNLNGLVYNILTLSVIFREQSGPIEDMYAPIQKKKKPSIEVNMVDNNLYGSTDD